ncbi:nucleotide exchange factor GrpE [Demequina sediminicola]|uniref:nucleotide exchange factor GrpE n=1 Tax=Demequina sediminicola TaxID=1095026 RepID=UPI0009E36522|nr:nucleotide exchange factor GrpE [Demequina sediminicola]
MTDQNPTPEQGDDQDPLAEAESIINEAAQRAEAAGEAVEAEVADLESAAELRAAEHLADLQRLQAEYVNYRKRVDRDREAASGLATTKVVESLIPILDDIAAAREHGELDEGPFASIANKLEETLGRLGWESYGAVGDEFDPQLHEALTSQPSTEVEVPTVQLVAQPGHRIGDRVVRPARVIVAQPE